jgi:Fe2+ or Zn2+ uptake regulation protein
VCSGCGAVEDVELPNGLEGELEDVVTRMTGLTSFRAENHTLEVNGRCSRCR